MTDHYTTLGVAKTATADDIKRAYRRLASQHHPDRGGDTQRFQEIQAAYDVLSDPGRRAEYDNPAPRGFGPAQGFDFNFGSSHDFRDIFANMFGQGFAGAGQRRPQQAFVRLSLWIRLTDVITGGRRPVSVSTGQGTNTIEIDIPRGVNDGDTIQYQGLAPGGADLVVQFRVHPEPRWQRDGLNLTMDQDVPVWDMILGGDISVTTIQGDQLTVTLPAGCQTRTLMRLKGRGIADQRGQAGDLFVRVTPQIPRDIDPDLRVAIQKWRSK